MGNDRLEGLIVPVVTPTDSNEMVDKASFRKLIRYLINNKANGLFIGGSAGEGPLFTIKEWTKMMETAYVENENAIPLLGGVADTSTMKVKEKIMILKSIGFKYFVLTPSYYYTLNNNEEFLRLFKECKEAGKDMEMIAYNIPSCTASVLPVDILCEMSKLGWISYCKESSGNITYLKELIDKGSKTGLKVLMGDEATMDKGLMLGACGIVPVCANYDPGTFIKLYSAAVKNDMDGLNSLQERVNLLKENLAKAGTCWIAGLKFAISCMGMGTGKPVSPLQPLSMSEEEKVRDFVLTDKKLI